MNIIEYMIDELITYVTDDALDLIYDDMYGFAQEKQKGISIEKLCDEYARDVLAELDNIYTVFTPDVVKYIESTVMANHEAYIDEEEFAERFDGVEFPEKEEENEIKLEYLFDKDYKNQDNLIDEYIINNIQDEENKKQLIKNKNKWFYKEFLKDAEGIKILENVINTYKIVPQNPIELGKIIEQLQQDGIIEENKGKISFINNFFKLYFLNNNDISINEAIKQYGEDASSNEIEIYNMFSYKNMEKFNKEFIKEGLDYYTKYMRKQNKYTISKFLIDKVKPTIKIKPITGNEVFCMNDIFFEYIGIDFIGNLMNLKYYKANKFLKNKYKAKNIGRYEINFSKAIRDEETIKQFEKFKVWNYFEDVYKKLIKLSKEYEKNNTKDFYMYFNNEKEFGKYIDKSDEDNYKKYL